MIPAMRHAFRRSSVRCACCLVFFFALFFAASASHAAAKSYSADRFDATVRVLPDGTLEVTETVVFRFESGTFREVFREIPVRRTDGIEIVRAEMEGVPLPFGNEAGTVAMASLANSRRVTLTRNLQRVGRAPFYRQKLSSCSSVTSSLATAQSTSGVTSDSVHRWRAA